MCFKAVHVSYLKYKIQNVLLIVKLLFERIQFNIYSFTGLHV